jgi:hypothetical protein
MPQRKIVEQKKALASQDNPAGGKLILVPGLLLMSFDGSCASGGKARAGVLGIRSKCVSTFFEVVVISSSLLLPSPPSLPAVPSIAPFLDSLELYGAQFGTLHYKAPPMALYTCNIVDPLVPPSPTPLDIHPHGSFLFLSSLAPLDTSS